MSGVGLPTGIGELDARGRSEWVASIFAAVGKMDRCVDRPILRSSAAPFALLETVYDDNIRR